MSHPDGLSPSLTRLQDSRLSRSRQHERAGPRTPAGRPVPLTAAAPSATVPADIPTISRVPPMPRSRPAAPASGDVPIGPMGSWSHDLRTGRIEWAEGTEELFGLPPGAFDGTFEAFLALVHPEDREHVARTTR